MSPQGPSSPLPRGASSGREGVDRLTPLVYEELRRIAHRRLRQERDGHTLSTTDLVHEAYLKLARLGRMEWQTRSHFCASAAGAMRQILVNHAISRKRQKRGGGSQRVAFDDAVQMADQRGEELLALNRALERLTELDERQAGVVECRFFGGMTVEETAEALDISPATVKRDWTAARAWLSRELEANGGEE
jgi:RNA polymerase sigma-70 factor, ECF subfamily